MIEYFSPESDSEEHKHYLFGAVDGSRLDGSVSAPVDSELVQLPTTHALVFDLREDSSMSFPLASALRLGRAKDFLAKLTVEEQVNMTTGRRQVIICFPGGVDAAAIVTSAD